MTAYVALLRAVNVGGTGKLPMTELVAMCEDAGFADVRTYIASGNVVFTADGSPSAVKEALEQRLRAYAGKPVGVMVRTAQEMSAIAGASPFPDAPGNQVTALFLDEAPGDPDTRHVADERIALGTREIWVHYPSGMGRSKLVLPAAARGTARNLNTVRTLAELAAALPG
ncbi:DUF1697 domain-containing protein [Microbacterium phosphatis]|uniref:DUF1697 domain-containing protein n=1 Tax=Microbacterium phosphatis TaxID=3140248 RepID=UPI0031401CDF